MKYPRLSQKDNMSISDKTLREILAREREKHGIGQEPINRKTVDAGYKERIQEAIRQYFGRKKQPKRTAGPSDHEQGQRGKQGRLF